MAESYWSLDDVINALVASLRGRPYIQQNEIQVEDCWPAEIVSQRTIWIDEARSDEMVASMRAGTLKYNEVYSLWVVCDAYIEGGSTQQARAALTPLVGEVLAEMAEEKRIPAVNKVLSARVAGWRYEPYVMTEGRGACCKVELKISGRR
jgi:hypothetical protein